MPALRRWLLGSSRMISFSLQPPQVVPLSKVADYRWLQSRLQRCSEFDCAPLQAGVFNDAGVSASPRKLGRQPIKKGSYFGNLIEGLRLCNLISLPQ